MSSSIIFSQYFLNLAFSIKIFLCVSIMAYFSPSATRELLRDSPLEGQTSIEILRVDRCRATGNTTTDVHAVFGDEVVNYIAVGHTRPMVLECDNASLAEQGDDIDTLQLL